MKSPRAALGALAVLFATGVLLQVRLSTAEVASGGASDVGLADGASTQGAASTHLFHGLLGVGLGLLLVRGFREKPEATAWVCFAFAVVLLLVAVGMGVPSHGLPYVVAGPLRIHATEWLAVMALLPTSWFLTGSLGSVRALAVFSPVMILSSVGGPTSAWSYFMGMSCMWALAFLERAKVPGGKVLPLATLLPACAIAVLPTLRFVRAPGPSAPAMYDGWVLADPDAGAHPGTEFVLGALRAHGGETAPWFAVALFSFAMFVLARDALSWGSQQARLLGVGFAAYAASQAAWNIAVARGLVPTPSSGVAFPFLSQTGTITLVSAAIVVVAAGLRAGPGGADSSSAPAR